MAKDFSLAIAITRRRKSSPCSPLAKELKAFAKVQLAPAERKTVTLTITRDALAYYDDHTREWVAEAGAFEVLIGASSEDIRGTAMFTLTASSRWPS
jgi:beta-glucosidase